MLTLHTLVHGFYIIIILTHLKIEDTFINSPLCIYRSSIPWIVKTVVLRAHALTIIVKSLNTINRTWSLASHLCHYIRRLKVAFYHFLLQHITLYSLTILICTIVYGVLDASDYSACTSDDQVLSILPRAACHALYIKRDL